MDSLLKRSVKIVKVFGPEHDFRGNTSNGAKLWDEMDKATDPDFTWDDNCSVCTNDRWGKWMANQLTCRLKKFKMKRYEPALLWVWFGELRLVALRRSGKISIGWMIELHRAYPYKDTFFYRGQSTQKGGNRPAGIDLCCRDVR